MSKRIKIGAVLPLSVVLAIISIPSEVLAQQTEAEPGTPLPAVTVEAPAAPKAKKKAAQKQQTAV